MKARAKRPFPDDPREQLRLATEAVFKSWNGKRAIDYRNAAGIAHDLGTAVNIQTMVFGNMGERLGHGRPHDAQRHDGRAPASRATGSPTPRARTWSPAPARPSPSRRCRREMPRIHAELARNCRTLEKHFREVQDVEFTIERGKLWMLQTRDAKRTAQAAVRIAVDLANEKLITRAEAVERVSRDHVDAFLHPQFDAREKAAAKKRGDLLATGLNVSPGAASGVLAFDADRAEEWGVKERKAVIMVRPETKPDDVHGMLAARGILTSRGGRTSHAALVARQFGKPAVVGVSAMEVDPDRREFRIGTPRLPRRRRGLRRRHDRRGLRREPEDRGARVHRPLAREAPRLGRRLPHASGVWANADYPKDARRARAYGAEGIGLCRTEHMFFETERLPLVQQMILATTDAERVGPLAKLLPFQREDFMGLFRAMDGLPVTIRLIDPPLHEFLPSHDELLHDVTEMETRASFAAGKDPLGLAGTLAQKRKLLEAVTAMREANPMLGLRGVRLGIHLPQLVRMQVRAIMEAACRCKREGVKVHPKIMIPLIAHNNELKVEDAILEEEARAVMKEQGVRVKYQFGTMIEIPRAALTAGEIARYAAVLLLRDQRPHADDLRDLAGRRRDRVPARVPREAHPPREPLRHDRPGRRGQAHGNGRAPGPGGPPGPGGRHLRRARGRPGDDRLLPPDRPRLRELLAVPGAGGPPGGRPGGAGPGGLNPRAGPPAAPAR